MVIDVNHTLFNEAKKVIPGGVNSPVRSFKGIGSNPIFMHRGKGALIYDEANREYIDYCMSWGPLLFGHAPSDIITAIRNALPNGTTFGTATKKEIEFARLIADALPSIEKVRLTSSGTEAVMSAIRLARGYTGRQKILKFEGSYHGHADHMLVKAGSGNATFGIPDSNGVPNSFTKHTLIAPFNKLDTVTQIVQQHYTDLAGIILEPVMANYGVILPDKNFLDGLRKLSNEYNIVLIFDEVITGFRLSYGGAQDYFAVLPDITCLGKIIGGGLPIGAFGGRADIMDLLAPQADVYQAGTLSGNPLAVTAGITMLRMLKERNPYAHLAEITDRLCRDITSYARKHNIKLVINHIGSLFSFFFTDNPVTDYESASRQDIEKFKIFFNHMLNDRIYLSPSAYETNFVSTEHTDELIIRTINTVTKHLLTL